jgi:ankyrin repeat protein
MKHLLLTTIAAVLLVGCGNPEADKALFKAIRNGKIEMVKEAIANGANVNTFNINIISPLHYAVSKSHNEIVELLISKGADVNFMADVSRNRRSTHSRGLSPLIVAINVHNVEGVRMLLVNGADINAKDGNTNGESPLFYSLNNDNIEITKMLIDEGADFNMRNNKNLTPLDRVIGWNDDFSAKLLRKHGGKTSAELKAAGN